MKRASITLLVLALSGGGLFAREASLPADLEERVSSIVARFPAETPAAKDALCALILSLGPGAVAEVSARVLPAGAGDDSRARFAVNGLAIHVMRPGAEAERTLFARALLGALGRTQDQTVAAFFLSQLRLVGKQESLAPLEKYLVDETLVGPAISALLTIGGPTTTSAFLRALDKAPRNAQLSLLLALG